jgi:hypothetical protein
LARNSRGRASTLVPGLVCLLVAVAPQRFGGSSAVLPGLAFAGVAAAWFGLGMTSNRVLDRALRLVLFIAVPLFPLQLAWSIRGVVQGPPREAFADQRAAPFLPARPGAPRMVWVIFDELDHELTFELRPSTVQLPHLDRLRSESMFATKAYPPADRTALSMPAFFTGRLVSGFAPEAPDRLAIRFVGRDAEANWSSQTSIFSRMRSMGRNAALFGWHHPYCRVLGGSMPACSWESNVQATPALRKENYAEATGIIPLEALRRADPVQFLRMGPDANSGNRFLRRATMRQYRAMLARTLDAVADPRLGLVVVHWMVPHPPGIYSRSEDTFAAAGNSLDNLELVDQTIGRILEAVDGAGLAGSTALLITGDHPLRRSIWSGSPLWTEEEERLTRLRRDPRVPFVLKLPGAAAAVSYTQPFNAVLAHDLVVAVLSRQVQSPESTRAWLDRNRSRFPPRAVQPGPDANP